MVRVKALKEERDAIRSRYIVTALQHMYEAGVIWVRRPPPPLGIDTASIRLQVASNGQSASGAVLQSVKVYRLCNLDQWSAGQVQGVRNSLQ